MRRGKRGVCVGITMNDTLWRRDFHHKGLFIYDVWIVCMYVYFEV